MRSRKPERIFLTIPYAKLTAKVFTKAVDYGVDPHEIYELAAKSLLEMLLDTFSEKLFCRKQDFFKKLLMKGYLKETRLSHAEVEYTAPILRKDFEHLRQFLSYDLIVLFVSLLASELSLEELLELAAMDEETVAFRLSDMLENREIISAINYIHQIAEYSIGRRILRKNIDLVRAIVAEYARHLEESTEGHETIEDIDEYIEEVLGE